MRSIIIIIANQRLCVCMTMWQCVLIANPWQVGGGGGEGGVITWSVQSGHTISRTTIHKQYVYGDDDCDGREWQITQIHKGFNKFYLHELQKTQCYSQIYTYKNMPKYIYKFTHLYLYTNMITYLSSNTTWRICKCTCCIFVYVHKGPL